MKSTLFGLLLVLFLVPGLSQETQQQQQEQDDTFRIGVDVSQVFLSVNARSVNGGFATDLAKDDFQVFEQGVRQEIVNFSSDRVPVHVVLLIDSSGSTRYAQGEIRRAALQFAREMGEEDRVAVITFNAAARLILNWTNDQERIQLALERIYAKGPTVLHDALYVTFDDLMQGIEGRKAVILLTDGVDTGSLVGMDEAAELSIRSESMIYVVSKLDEYWQMAIQQRFQFQAAGRPVPRELTDDYIIEVRRALRRIAETSGGKILDTRNGGLIDIYAQVAEELKNQYYLSYSPSERAHSGRWREIQIRADLRPDVVVSTRKGYYAP